jgi:5-methylcytosine-specific restriction endonuclease McrA
MFTASSTISRAMEYYIPRGHHHKRNKIFVFGVKKRRYYYGDRENYRNEYLRSNHWRELRRRKLKETPLCENCGNGLHVELHHINYKNLYDVELSDLKTLCRKCHIKAHVIILPTKRKKKYRRIKHVFRCRQTLVRRVSKIANMRSEDVEKFLSKMAPKH